MGNFEQFGTYHTACGRVLKNRHFASDHIDLDRGPSPSIDPVHHIIEGARAYNASKGLQDPHDGSIDYHKVTTHRGLITDLGSEYDKLPLNDPRAHRHFQAMRDEVNSQYHHLTGRMGIKVQVMDHDPYKDVHELRQDVEKNKTLKVLGTQHTGGHPFFTNDENDRFRAVHDAFGHLATGRDFDRHGEEAAFQSHARMFSHHALPAMTSETRGQNGSLILNGHFGPQRIAVLPHRLWHPGLAHFGAAEEVRTLSRESSVQRMAELVDIGDRWLLDDVPLGLQVEAHVSGNQIDILHCPFCGSGSVIGRSDGTVECGYCTSVFTVQVQPAYNGFPQSVDGQPYNWPGQPNAGDPGVAAPTAPPGTDMAPGQEPPMGDEDALAGGADPNAENDSPAFTKPQSSDPSASDDDDDSDDDDKDSKKDKKKGDNPFAKKKSYRTVNGAELPADEFVAHLAIKYAKNPQKVAARVKGRRDAYGEL